MTNDVLVSVKGTQKIDGECDSIEVITMGTWHEKDGKPYIRYEENIEGLGAPAQNMVKIQPDLVEVTKKGALASQMVFEPGKKHMANYRTPVGLVVLGLTTSKLQVAADEDRIRVEIDYSLEMNGQYVSECSMEIVAQAKGAGTQKFFAGDGL